MLKAKEKAKPCRCKTKTPLAVAGHELGCNMDFRGNYTTKQTLIDELRTRIGTPAELLQQYYGLTPKHGKVACPHHNDKTPSMKVYAENVHCFGCGWHGDSLDIYAKANNLTLQEAIRRLRQQAGDIGEGWREKAAEAKRRRQIEEKIHEDAQACFRSLCRLRHGINLLLPRFQTADAEDEGRRWALFNMLSMRQAIEEVLPVFYSGDRSQDLQGVQAARRASLWE